MNDKYIEMVLGDSLLINKIKDENSLKKFKRSFLEKIDVIDNEGNTIGSQPRGLCHRLGLRHKTVFVMVVHTDGKILLQKRGGGIDSILKRLDIAVAGHFEEGEKDPIDSALREFEEELGLKPQKEKLKLIDVYNRDKPPSVYKPFERNRERRYLFIYRFDQDENKHLVKNFERRKSKGEVISVDWFSIREVIKAIDMGEIADGLLTSFMHYIRNKLNDNKN